MIKCIVCAERTGNYQLQIAFTCISCTAFLAKNGFTYDGETIEVYKAIISDILARPENSKFFAEIFARRQEQQQSVLDAIAKVGA